MTPPSIKAASELRLAIGDAEVAADALRRAGLDDRASRLDEHIADARKLRFSIGVVAQAKRGKSTLINGLLGRTDDELAPIDRFPATNVVSCFAQSPKESARVLFETDDDSSPGKVIPFEQIKEYACEEYNPDNRKGVRVIEVVGPFARLGENVVLVDTPGADNALNRMHDIVLLQFLPKLDAVMFLVSADAPLVESELELLKHIRKNDVRKLLFAMNKADKVDGEELQQGLQHNRRVLAQAGFGDAPIFSISAKNFHETGEDPGTEKLIRALEETISEGRAAAIAERLTALTESHVSAAAAEIRTQIENAELTSEEIAEKTAQLDEIRRTFEGNRDRLESKFRTSWNEAFDDFEDSLKKIERQLVREYTDLVEDC
jgi:GTPase Era involved in 16S rRNA processing